MVGPVEHNSFLITDLDVYLFKAGRHFTLYDKMGAHPMTHDQKEGVYFALWAPNATKVSVIGDFNSWDSNAHPLAVRWDSSGIWEGFIPGIKPGCLYKFYIQNNEYKVQKIDPFAFYCETPPKTAAVVWDLSYQWNDEKWLQNRKEKNAFDAPLSIYEVHLGSWKRKDHGFLNYRELARDLVKHVKEMGFTHIELLPIMEHPFYGSWGYQTLGFYAPTSRYGAPQDFMYFVDYLHQNDIGIILDWSPAHFPNDEYGLSYFDGSFLYEHEDPKKGFHPDWNSLIFNYGRKEVTNYLVSSALFFLDKYHVDGIRIDAVASMLYLDYSRKAHEWIPNIYGGNENLEAIEFLRVLNSRIHEKFPDVLTIAEESTAWPMITKPVEVGGLGFHYKWNLGWMHDTFRYVARDPIYRKYHHDEILFSMIYAYSENFILVFSHDEVVHGKGAIYQKIPKDEWQKYATIRLLLGYKFTHPGKKLLFMGSELGQREEWNHDIPITWELAEKSYEQGVKSFVQDINQLYKMHPALFRLDFHPDGFEWIDASDSLKSIYSYLRKDPISNSFLAVVCNFTPEYYTDYRVGVPFLGNWKEILNSDHTKYGGSGKMNSNVFFAENIPHHNRPYSISLSVPPLAVSIIQKENT